MTAQTANVLFVEATRYKYRFPYKGQCTVEDLWDLPVTELDKIYKALKRQLADSSEESLLAVHSAEDKITEAKVSIVSFIVKMKIAEADAAKLAMAKKERNQRIMEIIANKEDAALQNLSVEELKKMLEEQ